MRGCEAANPCQNLLQDFFKMCVCSKAFTHLTAIYLNPIFCCTSIDIIQWFLSSYNKHLVFTVFTAIEMQLTRQSPLWTKTQLESGHLHLCQREAIRGHFQKKKANCIKPAWCFRLERKFVPQCKEMRKIPFQSVSRCKFGYWCQTPNVNPEHVAPQPAVTQVPLFHHIPLSSSSPCMHMG